MSEIRILNNAGSLSESDMTLISGTSLVMQMMRNRVLVVTDNTKEIDWLELTEGMTGVYHIRSIDAKRLYQVWFESKVDMETFEKNLFVSKMADNAYVTNDK